MLRQEVQQQHLVQTETQPKVDQQLQLIRLQQRLTQVDQHQNLQQQHLQPQDQQRQRLQHRDLQQQHSKQVLLQAEQPRLIPVEVL